MRVATEARCTTEWDHRWDRQVAKNLLDGAIQSEVKSCWKCGRREIWVHGRLLEVTYFKIAEG